MRSKDGEQAENQLYLMNSDSLELYECTAQEIITKLNLGEFVYENQKYKMDGIDMEEK